jgi:hypothetical protein
MKPTEREPGASVDDTRVYTGSRDLGYKCWGVKPPEVDIEHYWAIRDPEKTRDQAETYHKLPDSASTVASPPQEDSPPGTKRKPGRPRKSPNINDDDRVKKATTPPPKTNENTRRSGADKVDDGNPNIGEQSRKTTASSFKPGRRGRGRPTVNGSLIEEISRVATKGTRKGAKRGRKPGPGNTENTSDIAETAGFTSMAKSRRRTPASTLTTKANTRQQTKSPVRGNAKVTKSKTKEERPSIHTMRTRARGPAESRETL